MENEVKKLKRDQDRAISVKDTRINDLTTQLGSLRTTIEDLGNQVKSKEETLNTLRKNLDSSSVELQSKDSQLQDLQAQVRDANLSAAKEVAHFQQESNSKDDEVKNLRHKVQVLEAAGATSVAESQRQFQCKDREADCLRKKVEDLKAAAAADATESQHQLEFKDSEAGCLRKMVEDLEAAAATSVAESQRQFQCKDREADCLRKKVEDLEAAAAADATESQHQLESKDSEAGCLRKMVEDLEAAAAADATESQRQLGLKEDELKDLRAQITHLETSKEQSEVASNQQLSRESNELRDLRQQLTELATSLRSKEKENYRLDVQVSALKVAAEDAEDEFNREIAEKDEEIQNVSTRENVANDRLHNTRTVLADTEQDLNREIDRQNTEIEELQSQLKVHRRRKDNQDSSTREIPRLKRDLEEANSKNRDMVEQIHQMLNTELKEVDDLKEQLRDQARESKEEIASLRQQLCSANAILDEAEPHDDQRAQDRDTTTPRLRGGDRNSQIEAARTADGPSFRPKQRKVTETDNDTDQEEVGQQNANPSQQIEDLRVKMHQMTLARDFWYDRIAVLETKLDDAEENVAKLKRQLEEAAPKPQDLVNLARRYRSERDTYRGRCRLLEQEAETRISENNASDASALYPDRPQRKRRRSEDDDEVGETPPPAKCNRGQGNEGRHNEGDLGGQPRLRDGDQREESVLLYDPEEATSSHSNQLTGDTLPAQDQPDATSLHDNQANIAAPRAPLILRHGTWWTIGDVLDPRSASDLIPLDVIQTVKDQIRDWDTRGSQWRKAGDLELRCAASVVGKRKTKWTNGDSNSACQDCVKNFRVCCSISKGKVQLLPIPGNSVGNPGEKGHWIRQLD